MPSITMARSFPKRRPQHNAPRVASVGPEVLVHLSLPFLGNLPNTCLSIVLVDVLGLHSFVVQHSASLRGEAGARFGRGVKA